MGVSYVIFQYVPDKQIFKGVKNVPKIGLLVTRTLCWLTKALISILTHYIVVCTVKTDNFFAYFVLYFVPFESSL